MILGLLQILKLTIMQTNTLSQLTGVDRLLAFIKAGGPQEFEYDELTQTWDNISAETDPSLSLTKEKLKRLFGAHFLSHTLQGFSYRKPYGYSGDFKIIDLIYQQEISRDKRYQKWDKYFQSIHACRAVRNRKSYFINLVKEKCATMKRPLRILNVASGPCRDILEMFEQIPACRLQIHCVERDSYAIAYAQKLLGSFADRVAFIQKNIFDFEPAENFDLIWSAGLFDYFKDEAFTNLLAKFRGWCAHSGEVVIGNFSVDNPSRSYMEKGTNWYLFHRTDLQLKQLATAAGFHKDKARVKSEALGVNLFLHACV